MRPGYQYVMVERGTVARSSVDSTGEEFAETMGYGRRKFRNQDDFLQCFQAEWIVELHRALREILTPDRSILSLGSGLAEHEVPFFLDGYEIVASDIWEESLHETAKLFPGFRGIFFDVFNPDLGTQYDDVLATGLEYAFDQEKAQLLFHNIRKILKPNGRLIFTLRYNNNLATWFIDVVLLPLVAAIRNAKYRLQGLNLELRKRHHGYRRSRSEIIAMGNAAGFRMGRIIHGGFGVELTRIELDCRLPKLYKFVRKLDREMCILNNVTVFEFRT